MGPAHTILAVLAAAPLVLAAPQEGAQPTEPRAGPDAGALVAALGDERWAVRQSADEALRLLEPPGLGPIEPLLALPDLNPEQRARLTEIARERFVYEPHAGMGVGFRRDDM